MTTDLAERDTLETLARVHKESIEKIERAYTLLDEAREAMKQTFKNDYFEAIPSSHYGCPLDVIPNIKESWKRRAWSIIFERSGMKKVLSIKRRSELDKQLSDGKDLPDITPENILALIQDGMEKATDYAAEAAYEVFDWLRPWNGTYKTNDKWKVGPKVVLAYMVERSGWGGNGKFRVRYSHQKELIALDNVFHMLDGRGPIKGYNGPLIDAIQTAPDGNGETDFFAFKSYQNGNLHLKFKRTDLVDRLNYIAGQRDQIGEAA